MTQRLSFRHASVRTPEPFLCHLFVCSFVAHTFRCVIVKCKGRQSRRNSILSLPLLFFCVASMLCCGIDLSFYCFILRFYISALSVFHTYIRSYPSIAFYSGLVLKVSVRLRADSNVLFCFVIFVNKCNFMLSRRTIGNPE